MNYWSTALFARLLELPPGAGLRRMYAAALAPGVKLVEPVLSAAQHEGANLGAVGQAQLDMATDRLATYGRIITELRADGAEVVPLKGPQIASLYPAGLLRGCVDLDLFVSGPAQAWSLARRVADEYPCTEKNVSVLRDGDRYDVFIGLSWPSPRSALDAIYRVEFTTLPFFGDRRAVPPRPGLPATGALLQLLLVAEEQFQRDLGARDVLDALVLFDQADLDLDGDWAAQVESARLAPELKVLADAAAAAVADAPEAVGLHRRAAQVAASLVQAADREAGRRSALGTALGQWGELCLGLDLDGGATADVTFTELGSGTLLRCPLGSYLLWPELEVPEEAFDQAREMVR
jgi:hypothetical protein